MSMIQQLLKKNRNEKVSQKNVNDSTSVEE